jgi:hypothetical protein
MSEERIELRTAESRKLIRRLDGFAMQLREKIAVQKGQLEIVEDLLKYSRESVDTVVAEEEMITQKEEERESMQGVKTPKPRKKRGEK